MAHQPRQLRKSSESNAWDNELDKHISQETIPRPDLFLVITAKCIWPVVSYWQQTELYELAKDFCYSQAGVQGPVIQGDKLPPSDFLIIVPGTRVVPVMNRAASKFIDVCQKLWGTECATAAGAVGCVRYLRYTLHHVAVVANCSK